MERVIRISLLALIIQQLGAAQTRTEELEQLRHEHQQTMSPEKSTTVEEVLRRLKDDKVLERMNYGYNGLSVRLGGLVTGGGFAAGPQYLRNDIRDGSIVVGAGAQISVRNYQKADVHFGLQRLLNGEGCVRCAFNLPELSRYQLLRSRAR